jgi:hypothetical protein
MVGLSNYAALNQLNYLTGQVPMPTMPASYLALLTAAFTSDAGTGGTEVTGGAYARVQASGTATTNGTTASGNNTLHFATTPAWVVAGMTIYDLTGAGLIPAATTVLSTTGTTVVMSANATGAGVGNGDSIAFSAFSAASGSGPSLVTTSSILTFAQSTLSWGTVLAWSLYDALTSGNPLVWDYMGDYSWLPATVSAASPGVITAKAHGYAASDPLVWTNEFGGTVPTFSQSNFTGTLLAVGPTTDTFTVTNGGTAVNTSATGNGMVRKILQQPVAANTTVSFAAGTLTVSLA